MTQLAEMLTNEDIVKVDASDGYLNDEYGYSVAIDGDYMVVGAPLDTGGVGAIYIYEYDTASDTWVEAQKFAYTSGMMGEEVEISGDTVAVCIPEMNSGKGTVFVYYRAPSSGTWARQEWLDSPSPAYAENFGNVLALDGDILVCGSEWGGNTAYPCHRTGTSWSVKSFPATDLSVGDYFGTAVALFGTTAVVGGQNDNSGRGAVWFFEYDATAGTWSQTTKIYNPDAGSGDYFGAALAFDTSGTLLAIAAPGDADGGSGRGAIYVYELVTDTWTLRQKCIPYSTVTTSITPLGVTGLAVVTMKPSLSMANGIVYAGVLGYSSSNGVVVTFSPDTDWSTGYIEGSMQTSPAESGAEFGYDVCCDGTRLVVGARRGEGENIGSSYNEGCAYVIDSAFISGSSGAGDTTAPTSTVISPVAGTTIGPTDTLTIDVADETGLGAVVLMARYPQTPVERVTETVWNGSLDGGVGAFVFPFNGSTRTEIDAGLRQRFVITRAGGWKAHPTIDVVLVDAAGNEASV